MNTIVNQVHVKESKWPNFLAVFLVTVLFYSDRLLGGTSLGPLPLRIYIILIVFSITVLLTYKRAFSIPPGLKGILGLYFVYIVWHFIVTFINGDYKHLNLPNFFLSRYVSIFILTYILVQLVRKRSTLRWILYGIWSFLFLNVLTVVFQQLQFDPAWYLADIVSSDITYLGDGKYYFRVPSTYPPKVPIGLMGFVVTTGYMIAGFFPLVFIKYFKGQHFRFILFAILGLSAALFSQQRSSLLVTTLFFGIMLYSFSRYKTALVFLGVVVIGLLTVFSEPIFDFILENVLRNADKFEKGVLEDSARTYTYLHAFKFIGEYPFFGGRGNYYGLYPYFIPPGLRFTPHNIILNGYVDAGIIGVTLIFSLFVASIKRVFLYFKEFKRHGIYLPFLMFSCGVCFMFNSLFHSAGFTSGDNFFWWFAILAAIELKLSHNQKMNVTTN